MKIQKRRLSAAIAFSLIISIAATFVTFMPIAFGDQVESFAYLAVTPNVAGKGDRVVIIGWVVPPTVEAGDVYHDYTFTVTKPDLSTDEYYFETSNYEATRSFGIICDQVGTWSVVFSYPGNEDRFGATSQVIEWTVLEETPEGIPDQPLPTYPWHYPIPADFKEWYQISGAWEQGAKDEAGSNYNPYTKAPNTPHILWTKQFAPSGLIGGEGGWAPISRPFHSNSRALAQGQIVSVHGRVYYVIQGGYDSSTVHTNLYCFDLFTGEELWMRDDIPGGFKSNIIIELDPQEKTFYPEWNTTEGEIVQYFPESYGRITMWLCGGGETAEINPVTGETMWWTDEFSGNVFKDSFMYVSNFPESGNLSKLQTGTGPRQMGTGVNTETPVWTIEAGSITRVWDDILVRRRTTRSGDPYFFKIITYNATTGELIVDGPDIGVYAPESAYVVGDGKLFQHMVDRRTYAISLYTGEVVWKSEPMDYPWGVFSSYTASVDEDHVYMSSYDGHMYAYNIDDGTTAWKFYTGDTFETGQNSWGTWGKLISADGKIYFGAGEHTPPTPSPKGFKLYCLDQATGEEIWSLDNFQGDRGFSGGISSGVLYYMNQYDGRLYGFGKGETMTTVSAPTTAVPLGEPVLIQGTVTDQTPSIKGTPAVSDASQAAWMGYLYMDKPMPSVCEGVSVTLQGVRSDGTVFDIGKATSDILGHYEFTWTPSDKDTYKILATFEGSESYWTSSEETALVVTEGVGPSGPIEPEPIADYTITIVAAVVAVVVVALVAFWAIRRRK